MEFKVNKLFSPHLVSNCVNITRMEFKECAVMLLELVEASVNITRMEFKVKKGQTVELNGVV